MLTEEIYNKYRAAGISVIPTQASKAPLLEGTWLNGFEYDKFKNASFYGLICGKLSGGLQCLDIDNHFGDAKENLISYLAIPEVKAIYDKYKLPIEKSQNGGYHIAYRCENYINNTKLAMRWNPKISKSEALFEMKGDGGYFCAYPSKGYTVIKNSFFEIATITNEESTFLVESAISFNEFEKEIDIPKSTYESGINGDRPGDLYNENPESIEEMKSLLTIAGWKDLGGTRWRRPDKTEGISATLGKVAPNVFYCFTSSGYPFDECKAYKPFQVLGLLKFNGDFKEAAKSIMPEKEQTAINPQPVLSLSELDKILLKAEIDIDKKIERPPTIISIKEQQATSYVYKRVFTLGNFSCIIGKAKSRKTFLLSLITAAALSKKQDGKFIGDMVQGKTNVLYFDTEQGDYDSQHVMQRIILMAGNKENLKAYSLRPYSPSERCQIIEHAFKAFGEKTGLCIIDGIADLAFAINDEIEATRVTTILLRLSKVYNCHISTVIHQNKNDNFATGHLGSSIMKKAEVLISVTKKEDISIISCDMIRGTADFEPFEMSIDLDGIPHAGATIIAEKEKEDIPKFSRNKTADCTPLPTYAERYEKQEDYFTSGEIPTNLGF